jgi:hypothetical protein
VVTSVNGMPVKSIVDLNDLNTKIYETHYGMTQEWANQLLGLGYSPGLPLSFDRVTGAVNYTLGDLAAQAPGTDHETFHFVLNNTVAKDNRIPPYGMSYEEARQHNALPVPATQYGDPGAGGTYSYWDEIALNPPAGAAYADIELLYQPTSWEYVQFLYLANTGQNAFLSDEGVNLLDAWLNTGMAEPHVMASAVWGASPLPPGAFGKVSPADGATDQATSLTLDWGESTGATGYEYCYDIDDDACTNWVSTGTTTSADLSGLSYGTTYYWQVRAINSVGTTYADGGAASYWSFTTVAAPQPPGAFSKVSPADGATDQATSLTLDWGESTGATSYEYCYDIDDAACDTWISTGTTTNADLSGLSYSTTYYWQVRAINAVGTTYADGGAASYWSFTIVAAPQPPGAFGKVSPADGATGQATSLTLDWGESTGATSYEYCYDIDDAACDTWISTGTTTSVDLSGLSYSTTYYWQVRAVNAVGTTYADGGAASYWSFITEAASQPPGAFGKVSPADGAIGQATSLTLDWGESTGATSYEYCYDTNGGACTTWISTGATSSADLSGLSYGTTYYWQVRAINPIGTTYANGSADSYWRFTSTYTVYLPVICSQ